MNHTLLKEHFKSKYCSYFIYLANPVSLGVTYTRKFPKMEGQVAKISGSRLCLVEAVCKALNKDLGIKNSKNAQAKKIWLEIKN